MTTNHHHGFMCCCAALSEHAVLSSYAMSTHGMPVHVPSLQGMARITENHWLGPWPQVLPGSRSGLAATPGWLSRCEWWGTKRCAYMWQSEGTLAHTAAPHLG